MRLLLDTHALLWWLAQAAIAGAALAAASAAGAYEIALKVRQGKLSAPRLFIDDCTGVMAARNLLLCAIDARHASAAGDLPLIHRDPFRPAARRAGED